MSTLDTYRARVPAHAAVPDAVVSAFLADAVASLDATAFGTQLDLACVWWAAAQLDPDVQAGMYPIDGSCVATPVDPKKVPPPPDYQARFERIRDSRAASGPMVVGPSCR